jgi:DNA-directed RNA polymerase specialized sigma subunit
MSISKSFDQVLSDIFDRNIEHRFESADAEREAIALAKNGDNEAVIALMYAYSYALNNAVKWFTRALPSADKSALEEVRLNLVTGLIEAVRKFDASEHKRLAAIIKPHLTEQISETAVSASAFTVPRRTLIRFFSILRHANGNVYEAAALAPSYSMATQTFLAVLSALRGVESYDADSSEDEASDKLDRLDSAQSIYGVDLSNEDRLTVEAAFEAVDELETDVCKLAYGFTDYDPVADAEIGHRLGLSRPKVQRVRSGALGKMRQALGVA